MTGRQISDGKVIVHFGSPEGTTYSSASPIVVTRKPVKR